MSVWDKDNGKGTLEWQMFVDMFVIVKKYWTPKENQSEEYVKDINDWFSKYSDLDKKNPNGSKESIERARTLSIWSKCIMVMLCDAFDKLTEGK